MKLLMMMALLASACATPHVRTPSRPVLHLWLMSEARGTVLLPLELGSNEYPSEEQRAAAKRIFQKVCLDAGWRDGAHYIGYEGLSNFPNLKTREYQWVFHCGWPDEWQPVPGTPYLPDRDLR